LSRLSIAPLRKIPRKRIASWRMAMKLGDACFRAWTFAACAEVNMPRGAKTSQPVPVTPAFIQQSFCDGFMPQKHLIR
jgi:hypothetical protein